jgi:hypothetical protein
MLLPNDGKHTPTKKLTNGGTIATTGLNGGFTGLFKKDVQLSLVRLFIRFCKAGCSENNIYP